MSNDGCFLDARDARSVSGAEIAMPKRVQMTRKRPWRVDHPDAVIVARPSRWGNPFIIGKYVVPPIERYHVDPVYVRDAAHAVRLYRKWLLGSANRSADLAPELGGRDLACWCPIWDTEGNRVPCHADVLLELANRKAGVSLPDRLLLASERIDFAAAEQEDNGYGESATDSRRNRGRSQQEDNR